MSESTEKPNSKPIEVDLEDLIIALHSEMYDAIWFLDLETGDVKLFYD